MQRYLTSTILKDCASKIILISGPRQCGKTTLTKQLFANYDYLNYDNAEHRALLNNKRWRRDAQAVIFDELHKMREWKRWLKGVFDVEGNQPHLFVTGSANLETFRKVGDSLAGRFFRFRMHPIDIKEACVFWQDDAQAAFERLMSVSGFPEVFLNGDPTFYRRWQESHLNIILRQDFLDLYAVRSLKNIELLVEMLKSRVGSTISYANLAQDLEVDPKSIKNWLGLLQDTYALFKVTPYHKNIARSTLKEPKFYFFDIGRATNLPARLENLVACALLKELHFVQDAHGYAGSLHYLKTKDGHEIDFLVIIDDKPVLCLEVKQADAEPSKNFAKFAPFLGKAKCVQLVLNLNKEFDTPQGISVRSLVPFLKNLDLLSLMENTL